MRITLKSTPIRRVFVWKTEVLNAFECVTLIRVHVKQTKTEIGLGCVSRRIDIDRSCSKERKYSLR